MPFIYLFFLTAGAKIFSAMLNISGKSGHPCFVPDLGGKTFNFSPLSMLAVGSFYMAFIMLSYIYSIPNLLRVFGYEKMLNFVKCSFSNY